MVQIKIIVESLMLSKPDMQIIAIASCHKISNFMKENLVSCLITINLFFNNKLT